MWHDKHGLGQSRCIYRDDNPLVGQEKTSRTAVTIYHISEPWLECYNLEASSKTLGSSPRGLQSASPSQFQRFNAVMQGKQDGVYCVTTHISTQLVYIYVHTHLQGIKTRLARPAVTESCAGNHAGNRSFRLRRSR